MLLKQKSNGKLVEVIHLEQLFSLFEDEVLVRDTEQAAESVCLKKAELLFPTGEALPRCWTDPHYRDN